MTLHSLLFEGLNISDIPHHDGPLRRRRKRFCFLPPKTGIAGECDHNILYLCDILVCNFWVQKALLWLVIII